MQTVYVFCETPWQSVETQEAALDALFDAALNHTSFHWKPDPEDRQVGGIRYDEYEVDSPAGRAALETLLTAYGLKAVERFEEVRW